MVRPKGEIAADILDLAAEWAETHPLTDGAMCWLIGGERRDEDVGILARAEMYVMGFGSGFDGDKIGALLRERARLNREGVRG